MAENTKKYWQGIEVLNEDPEFLKHRHDEFAEELPLEESFSENSAALKSNRRDFLKMFGFGISAAALAACRDTPVKKAIPYLVKPESITPGVANYFASTCSGCSSSCGILVKVRDGRPIKIEGNELTFNGEGTCATGQATVLSLYDNYRVEGPLKSGAKSSWSEVDNAIRAAIADAKANGGKVRVLSGSINSPSTLKAINTLVTTVSDGKHVQYDPVSFSGMLSANQAAFGKYALPTYRFDKAQVIAGINCDFLGTWISPAEHARQYAIGRKIDGDKKSMSKHYQVESLLSLTGSNADERATIRPGQEGAFVVALYNEIAKKAGSIVYASSEDPTPGKMAARMASDLWKNKGNSLVVCGSNHMETQMVVNAINVLLGNYGTTLSMGRVSYQKSGNDADMAQLLSEMKSGQVHTLIIYGANPVYDYPAGNEFKAALAKVKNSISLSDRLDETSAHVAWLCPDNHFLESWNDHQPIQGHYTLTQPTIPALFDTRQAIESFLTWSGQTTNAYEFVQTNWKSGILGEGNWNQALHDGVYESFGESSEPSISGDIASAMSAAVGAGKSIGDVAVVLYEKIGIRDGRMANNPWLQEFPDPISKTSWDNYAALSNKFAEDNSLKQGDLIEVKSEGYSITLPVLIQPGQAYGTIAIAVGYGRGEGAGKTAASVGQNAYPFAKVAGNGVQYTVSGSLSKVEGSYELAQTQIHHYIEGRNIVKETTLAEWTANPKSGNPDVTLVTPDGAQKPHTITLWDNYDHTKGHHWGMVIDLNACTGCGSCVVACQAENNIAVVGKREVLVRREMHWIRIDRYYNFKDDGGNKVNKEKEIGKVQDFENVQVLFQPMLCQHCDNAPCETVCPVLATVHSAEGLNQQAYNRCIGTRYCANNCPYKVRRFNWFDYAGNEKFDYTMYNSLNRMVLNPDVTVRSRGVMEKCSFCVQKIQEGKLASKKEGKVLADGVIKTACQKVCPSNAIHFGDKNDPNSSVSKLLNNERNYQVLEEVKTLPNVSYLTKVRNIESSNA